MRSFLVLTVVTIAAVLSAACAEYADEFNNVKVYKVFVDNAAQLEEFKKLADNVEVCSDISNIAP